MKHVLAVLVALAALQPPQQTPTSIVEQIGKLVTELKQLLTQAQTITVRDAAALQVALDSSVPGTVLELEPVPFVGNFVMRRAVQIQTRGVTLPDRTVEAGDISSLATIRSPNNAPALLLAPGVNLTDVAIRKVHLEGPANDVLLIGMAEPFQTSLSQVPRRIILDQISIKGVGAKNGIGLHGAEVSITRSLITDVARAGVESHGIVGTNGPGPFLIERNRIVGSSIGILFGGSDPQIPGLIPSDIIIRNNVIYKPLTCDGCNYASKNIIECKSCRRIQIIGNELDGSPVGGQSGWGIVITPSQYGTNPDVIVEDYTFSRNTVRNVGGVFNILGFGQNQSTRPTRISRNITVSDNWLQCDRALGDHGSLAQLGNGPVNVVFEYNTIQCNGDAFLRTSDTAPIPGFRYTNNLQLVTGTYGLFLAGSTRGAMLAERLPGAVISGNALVAANALFRTNLPNNLYLATGEGLIVDGYGAGAASGYGRRR